MVRACRPREVWQALSVQGFAGTCTGTAVAFSEARASGRLRQMLARPYFQSRRHIQVKA